MTAPGVRFAIGVPNIGEFADPRLLADMAVTSERSGWDGFFVWDHLLYRDPMLALVDPWIAVAAAATLTDRIRLGVLVAALARRRPWIVARQSASLDHLSGGRLVFGAGLGSLPSEFAAFGEDADERVRGRKLDEALEVLASLWSGATVQHRGEFFSVDDVSLLPTPVQQPRIPVWVGGRWPHRRPFRRAARWDGVMPTHVDYKLGQTLPPSVLAEIVEFIGDERGGLDGFDVALEGQTPGDPIASAAIVAPYIDAGLTWWIEALGWWRGDVEASRRRIAAGPPAP